ncbi:MAG: hypothetical protein LBL84_03640 [Candidatus Nomurabacteria bacterium]|jgi:hypothetical protein|nr:hypothetical protein [Candidatus Nomurabacteria bacterium]
MYVPRNVETAPTPEPEAKQTVQPDWFNKLTEILAKKRQATEAAEALAPSTEVGFDRPEVQHHDPDEFFRKKLINPNRVRDQQELKRCIAGVKAREADILGHRDFAKQNRRNTVSTIDFITGGKLGSNYYNDCSATVLPFSRVEVTDEWLAELESRAASGMFGPGHDFVFVNKSWVYHRQPEHEGDAGLTIRYTCHENGIKKYDDKQYTDLDPKSEEWAILMNAIETYHSKVSTEVYRRSPADINGDGVIDQRDYDLAA